MVVCCVHILLQICLLCRRHGHSLKNCPNKDDKTMDKKLCYNCGGTGHSLAKCPQPLQEGNVLYPLICVLEHVSSISFLTFMFNLYIPRYILLWMTLFPCSC